MRIRRDLIKGWANFLSVLFNEKIRTKGDTLAATLLLSTPFLAAALWIATAAVDHPSGLGIILLMATIAVLFFAVCTVCLAVKGLFEKLTESNWFDEEI